MTSSSNKLLYASSSFDAQMSNVVATTDLQCKPDLKQVYLQVRNAEYNPKK